MTDQPSTPLTNGDVWTQHGHPNRPCSPPEAVSLKSTETCRLVQPSTPAPSGGDALTDDERKVLLYALTEPERDEIRKALRYWLPVSYEGGVPYLAAAVERILAARAAQPTTPTAVEARTLIAALHAKWDGLPGRIAPHIALADVRAALAQDEGSGLPDQQIGPPDIPPAG